MAGLATQLRELSTLYDAKYLTAAQFELAKDAIIAAAQAGRPPSRPKAPPSASPRTVSPAARSGTPRTRADRTRTPPPTSPAARGGAPRCPGGHGVLSRQRRSSVPLSWRGLLSCTSCGAEAKADDFAGCRRCDYDLCRFCYAEAIARNAARRPPPPPPASPPVQQPSGYHLWTAGSPPQWVTAPGGSEKAARGDVLEGSVSWQESLRAGREAEPKLRRGSGQPPAPRAAHSCDPVVSPGAAAVFPPPWDGEEAAGPTRRSADADGRRSADDGRTATPPRTPVFDHPVSSPPSAPPPAASPPALEPDDSQSDQHLQRLIAEIVRGAEAPVSVRAVRLELESRLGLGPNGLRSRRPQIQDWTVQAVNQCALEAPVAAVRPPAASTVVAPPTPPTQSTPAAAGSKPASAAATPQAPVIATPPTTPAAALPAAAAEESPPPAPVPAPAAPTAAPLPPAPAHAAAPAEDSDCEFVSDAGTSASERPPPPRAGSKKGNAPPTPATPTAPPPPARQSSLTKSLPGLPKAAAPHKRTSAPPISVSGDQKQPVPRAAGSAKAGR
eukprot:TRINITY_DN3060_c0_g2_i2.p1 TRINITY_DN3060_c0_g2~~TRINITY_DN3060_c0_g2_i2.p1  ORF type:complete len:556 (+),score=151.53 TRINITY_DN3060_c0_g2_i2:64-1731(+)